MSWAIARVGASRPWPTFVRPLWRRVLWLRYRLFQTRRHDRLVLEDVAGEPILVLPGVFNPKLFRSGEFLARWTRSVVQPGQRVLDLGTGSGVGAVQAARQGARVVATDVNPAALRCARINALLHGLDERIETRLGDLYSTVAGQQFDIVLFNPPYYAGTPRDALDRAFRSNDVVERFAAGLDAVLAPGGRAILVLSSDAELARIGGLLQTSGFQATVRERRDLINEVVEVWEVTRARDHQGSR